VGENQTTVGLSRPFETRDSEFRVTDPIRFLAGYSVDPEDSAEQIPFYDYVTVQFIAQTIVREIASVSRGLFDQEFIESDANRLISRVSYGSIAKSNPDRRILFSYPSANTLLDRFKPQILTSTAISNVTNRVIIATTTQEVVFNELAAADAVIFS
jgi:hypothetical protein